MSRHGTAGGYNRHRLAGERPCQECKDFRAERQRRYRASLPPCTIHDCQDLQVARELCGRHLGLLTRKGDVNWSPPTLADRFWERVTEGDTPAHAPELGPCWIWTGPLGSKGYAKWTPHRGMHWLGHRWAYRHLRAEIPAGLEIDHLCRNKPCVNPWHLEPVSQLENLRRQHAAMKERKASA